MRCCICQTAKPYSPPPASGKPAAQILRVPEFPDCEKGQNDGPDSACFSFRPGILCDPLLNGIVDFLTDQARDLGRKELTDRIAALRSDARFRQQIQEAAERAAWRWAESYPDRELVRAVAEDTRFVDLPSVQQAIREFARNPFSPVADETLRGKFGEVLPDRFEPERVAQGVAEFLRMLSEEFATIPALRETLRTAASLRTAAPAATHSSCGNNFRASVYVPQTVPAPKRTESRRARRIASAAPRYGNCSASVWM